MTDSNKPKIRLAIQSPASFGFGGGHILAFMYKKHMSALGYDIDFLDFSDRQDDFDILHVIGMQLNNCLTGFEAKSKGKKIVLSSLFYTDANLFLYKLTEKIMSNRFMAFSQNKFFLMQQLLDISDVILPSCHAEVNQMSRIFNLEKSKVNVIYNGVDDDFFEGVDKNIFIQEFGVEPGYVLCVANINRKKNIANLINAFLKTDLNAKLVLVGIYNYDGDLEYCHEVERLIQENKSRIVHAENLSREMLASAYVNAKVHILPSLWDLPGLATMEAGLAGAQLIVGDCPPVREYFKAHALYCKPGDIVDISKKINEAYSLPSSNGTSNFIKTNYAWREIAKKLANVYDSL
jgi:glycosyltransferase involved in cell wall biosynthesis